jgi:hypothetical protein
VYHDILTQGNLLKVAWFMVLSATFNNISAISWWSVLLVEWMKSEKTTDWPQIIDKLYY